MRVLVLLTLVVSAFGQTVTQVDYLTQVKNRPNTISDTNPKYGNFTAACADAVSRNSTLEIGKSWTNQASLVASCNVAFVTGGRIQPASGATIQFTGTFEAPATQKIFAVSADRTVLITAKIPLTYQWWGADPTGATVSVVAIQAAANSAAAVNGTINCLPRNYDLGSTGVTVPTGSLTMISPQGGCSFLYSGSGCAFTVGNLAANTYNWKLVGVRILNSGLSNCGLLARGTHGLSLEDMYIEGATNTSTSATNRAIILDGGSIDSIFTSIRNVQTNHAYNALLMRTIYADWVSATTYSTGGNVTYLGLSYRALRTTVANIPSSSPSDWAVVTPSGNVTTVTAVGLTGNADSCFPVSASCAGRRVGSAYLEVLNGNGAGSIFAGGNCEYMDYCFHSDNGAGSDATGITFSGFSIDASITQYAFYYGQFVSNVKAFGTRGIVTTAGAGAGISGNEIIGANFGAVNALPTPNSLTGSLVLRGGDSYTGGQQPQTALKFQVPAGAVYPSWDTALTYEAGVYTRYVGLVYVSLRVTVGDQPDISASDWAVSLGAPLIDSLRSSGGAIPVRMDYNGNFTYLGGTATLWGPVGSSPEGNVAACVGALVSWSGGSQSSILYVKETGTCTNTGWGKVPTNRISTNITLLPGDVYNTTIAPSGGNRPVTVDSNGKFNSAPTAINVAQLNACAAGLLGVMQDVNDSSVTTWGSIVAGGGASTVTLRRNGTNWTVWAK